MRIAVAGATGLVGRALSSAARGAGHDVVELSRADGVDLVDGPEDRIDAALTGADAVVDVTNSPTVEQDGATAFFTTVAERLAVAATRAGVGRTVLLSIIGVDRTPEDGYFVAKLAHERAARRHGPEVRVLRAAQFHEFAEQSLAWGRDGEVARVPDMPIQPVALSEVVRVLLELATGPVGPPVVAGGAPAQPAGGPSSEPSGGPARAPLLELPDVLPPELAGPRPERLAELVGRLVSARGERLRVEPVAVSAAVRDGALLPGPDAQLAGPDFAAWLAGRAG
jgi:NAD(P)H-binding